MRALFRGDKPGFAGESVRGMEPGFLQVQRAGKVKEAIIRHCLIRASFLVKLTDTFSYITIRMRKQLKTGKKMK